MRVKINVKNYLLKAENSVAKNNVVAYMKNTTTVQKPIDGQRLHYSLLGYSAV
jgi:hypothetical protein